jgi:acetyltransferase-like isoleucine patch superfamily enzyme
MDTTRWRWRARRLSKNLLRWRASYVSQHLFRHPFLRLRILKFRLLSRATTIEGKPMLNQPVLFLGAGTIRIGNRVSLGYAPSPFLYNGYIHIEARNKKSRIDIGDDVWINNDCVPRQSVDSQHVRTGRQSAGIELGLNPFPFPRPPRSRRRDMYGRV